MEIRQIYYVMEVASHKSFSRAAKALFITQPTISQQISILEKELNVKLFNRSKYGVSLTDEGEKFCLHAAKIIDAVEDLTNEFNTNTSLGNLTLNIGLFPFYKASNLNEIIINFYTNNENVSGNIKVGENHQIYEMLKDERIDFGFIKSTFGDLNLDFHHIELLTEKEYLIMSINNPYSSREFIKQEELGNFTIVAGEEGSFYDKIVAKQWRKKGLNFNKSNIKTNEYELMLNVMEMDLGVLIGSEIVAKKYSNDKIVSLPIMPELLDTTYLVYSKSKKLSKVSMEFKKYILNIYDK